MNTRIRIGGFQIGPLEEEEMLEKLGEQNYDDLDMVVFPERFIVDTFHEFPKSRASKMLSGISKGRILVAGSVLEKTDKGIFNRSYVFMNGKIIGFQDKIVPFDREKGRVEKGRIINIFRTPVITFSVPICYDIDFPFYAKISALKGATLLINPSLIRKDFHQEWHLYIQSRSLENRISVISVNSNNANFEGDSIFVDTYEENNGVRVLKLEALNMDKFTCEYSDGKVDKKREQRKMEDPGYYSFPSKEIIYE